MAIVERGNVVLRISDEDTERYVNMGYDLVDEKGNIIQQSVPKSITTLQKMYKEHIEKIKQLETENAKLKAENKKLKKENSSV